MKNILAGLGILFLVMFGCGTLGSVVPAASRPLSDVTYKIGVTNAASLTYANESGDTAQLAAVDASWTKSFKAKPGQFLYLSAQNLSSYGVVRCEIWVDGKLIKQTRSDGGYVIASCSTSA